MNEPQTEHPEWEVVIDIPSAGEALPDMLELPTARGMFALEAENGGTLALVATANLRRLVRSRLEPLDDAAGPTRRVDYRGLTRRVRALRTHSAFETDWAYLLHARQRMPATYSTLFDRWSSWCIHCDPQAAHPRWTKVRLPGANLSAGGGYYGPFADKHAAQRYVETLQDAFDLCRYHHILVQSPDAAACAYKEMQRCPAPCDGTVSMTTYINHQVRASVDFAATTWESFDRQQQEAVKEAAANLDFERAQRLRTQQQRTKPVSKAAFRHVRALSDFSYLVLTPAEQRTAVTAFCVNQGTVLRRVFSSDEPAEPVEWFDQATRAASAEAIACTEIIALVACHLTAAKHRDPIAFIHRDDVDAAAVARSMKLIRTAEVSSTIDDDRGIDLAGDAMLE